MAATYNIIGAFKSDERARNAITALKGAGVDASHLRLVRPDGDGDADRAAGLKAEMQDEVAEGWAGPPAGPISPQQAKGAVLGSPLGLIAGVVIGSIFGLAWAFLGDAPFTPWLRFIVAVIPFAIGGSVAGAVAGGALVPRREGKRGPSHQFDDPRMAGERNTLVAVHLEDPNLAKKARRLLERSGAERVDAINDTGTPLPPQAETPRPADPPGRWWRGRRGRG